MDLITHYFPAITAQQQQRFEALPALYAEWNTRINVVSRKDMDNFVEHHVLHSLAIAKVIQFNPAARILDVGTGGGFPGVPLAILFPQTHFLLVDSIGKKIMVVNDITQRLGLTNVQALQQRAEQVEGRFDFIVSRAVTELRPFVGWVRNKVAKTQHHPLHNGLLCLKGGDLSSELRLYRNRATVYDISNFFTEPYFETKKVVHLPL